MKKQNNRKEPIMAGTYGNSKPKKPKNSMGTVKSKAKKGGIKKSMSKRKKY